MLQIVEESLSASEPVSVAEIFEAAYRDQAGKDYWRLWLKYERNEGAIGKLLAAHFRAENQDVAAAGHPYGWDWEACCRVALGRYPSGELADRLRAIICDEELGYLISPSVRAFLAPGDEAARKPKGGRPPAADWFAIEEAFNKEVDLLGLPRKDAEPGWRTAAEWLREHLDDAEPSKTAVNEHARKMLQRRMERDGN